MSDLHDGLALDARGVSVQYGDLVAVSSADLSVRRGEVMALIGETGSGKSSLALALARLLPPGTRTTGMINVDGQEIGDFGGADMRALRGSAIGYIAQDAMAALNPTARVGSQIAETFLIHSGATKTDAMDRSVAALRRVQIVDAERVARLYPHQLSGGMRQRVMIAMGVALNPALVIADEPTTALDVSTQAEILELIMALRSDLGAGILWITHDIGVVAEIADQVAVMYRGRVVEQGSVAQIFDAPQHPYTFALLRTLQDLRQGARGTLMFQIDGQPPRLDQSIAGCPFHPRCPRASERCRSDDPPVAIVANRNVACHHPLSSAKPTE